MKNIEIKKVASANEAVAIINRLNYMDCTFEYRSSTFSDDHATEYRHFNTDKSFAIVEIVQNGKLAAVRFYNLYRDITVELQLTEANINYDRFDNIINVDANVLKLKAEKKNYKVIEKTSDEDEEEFEKKILEDDTKLHIILNGNRTDVYMKVERKTLKGAYKVFSKAIAQAIEDGALDPKVAECPDFFCGDDWAIKNLDFGGKDYVAFYDNIDNSFAFGIDDNTGCDLGFYFWFWVKDPEAEQTTEADIEDYAVTAEAQDAAVEAEIEAMKIAREKRIAAGQKAVADHINACMEEEVKKFEAEVKAMLAKKKAETDGSEDDSDDEKVFNLLPEISELNDISDNITVIKSSDGMPTVFEFTRDGNEIKKVFVANGSVSYYNGEVSYISDEICRASYSARRQEFFISPTVDRVYPQKAYNNTEEFFAEMINRGVCSICEPPAPTTPSHEDETPADNFAETKARLQADVEAYQVHVEHLHNELAAANDNLLDAEKNLRDFLDGQANQLTSDLHAVIADKTIRYNRESGMTVGYINGENLYIDAYTSGFDFTYIGKRLATYETPAQVKAVIARIKETIERGESEFTFPTVNELNPPPAPEGQPTVQAVTEQLAEINSTAPEGMEIFYDAGTKKYPVVWDEEICCTLDSLTLYSLLPQKEFWERMKFGDVDDETRYYRLEKLLALKCGERDSEAARENPDQDFIAWLDLEIADLEGEMATLDFKPDDVG